MSEIKVTITLERERIADLLCSALEGGSTYWCEQIEVPDYKGKEWAHEAIAEGAHFIMRYDGGEVMPVTTDLQEAFDIFIDQCPIAFGLFMEAQDDAETGDLFFQCLCFGEVIYG